MTSPTIVFYTIVLKLNLSEISFEVKYGVIFLTERNLQAEMLRWQVNNLIGGKI